MISVSRSKFGAEADFENRLSIALWKFFEISDKSDFHLQNTVVLKKINLGDESAFWQSSKLIGAFVEGFISFKVSRVTKLPSTIIVISFLNTLSHPGFVIFSEANSVTQHESTKHLLMDRCRQMKGIKATLCEKSVLN